MNKWAFAVALIAASFVNPVSAAGDAAAGQSKAAVCSACHGGDGKAIQSTYPNLAGQHESYLAKQLMDFREGNRASALMAGQAANLSDQDIEDLAAYYASMDTIAVVASEENLTHGMNIYRGGITSAGVAACAACHGAAGGGNGPAAWPMVSGQNADYIADQLRYFRSGERANDPSSMMRGVAERMTDAEITAVANYMSGLQSNP